MEHMAAKGREEKDSTSKEGALLHFSSGTIYADTLSGRRTLLKDVSFSIREGEKLSLIGETGSGKTMLAMALMGRLPRNVRTEGLECTLDGKVISNAKAAQELLGREIAYIPQNGMEFLNPSRTVEDHIRDSLKRAGTKAEERNGRVDEVLSAVGFHDIDKIRRSYPFQLSGGMAQRITVALALSTRAKLIIADEPTNGLDQEAANRMLTHLSSLFPRAAKLFITHDIAVAGNGDRVLVLCGGKTLESGPRSFLDGPCSSYTQSLLASLVSNGMKPFPVLREKTGCPFSDRCPDYREKCRDSLEYHREGEHEWWCSR